MDRLTKINKNNKFKMAAAAMLNLIYRSLLVAIARTCTKFHMRAKFDVLQIVIP